MNSGSSNFNYSKHLTAAKAVPRFSEGDLIGFKKDELSKLGNSGPGQVLPPKVVAFRQSMGINGILNYAEQVIVKEFASKLAAKDLVSSEDVHKHINDSYPNYFTPKGLKYEKIVNGKKEDCLITFNNPWIVPSDLYANYPGLQIIVGFCLAFIKKGKDGRLVQFDDGTKLYQAVPFGGFAPSASAIFAQTIIDNIQEKFVEHKASGNGRNYISELLMAFSGMPKEAYLVMWRQLTLGPLSPCFDWGVVTAQNKIVPTPYNFRAQNLNWVPVKVRSDYVKSFANVANSPLIPALENGFGHTLGKLFPIMVNALPFKFNPPVVKSIPEAKAFLDICRVQRQADEKGLSAYSCGFAATGNPTKIQNRIQKKLSLIIGSLLSLNEKEKLVIDDDSNSEIEIIYNLLLKWMQEVPALKSKENKFKFYVRSTSTVFQKLKSEHRIMNYDMLTDVRILILSSMAINTVKATEWNKVELEMKNKLEGLFVRNAENRAANNVEYTVMLPIMSEELFKKTNPNSSEEVTTGYYVYGLGSLHSLNGIVSTMPQLPLGKSDGSDMWNLSVEMKNPLTYTIFLKNVVMHNLARSGFMIYPKFYFNPNLNFIRKLDGKTLNFETGEVEDIGIDLENNISNIGALSLDDYTPTQTETNAPTTTTTQSNVLTRSTTDSRDSQPISIVKSEVNPNSSNVSPSQSVPNSVSVAIPAPITEGEAECQEINFG
jgi:hypothetical protein